MANTGRMFTPSSTPQPPVLGGQPVPRVRRVLIDEAGPARLMVRFNGGVRLARILEIKRADLDYFDRTETE